MRIILVAVVLLISGCVVQKELIPTGGSRADGTIELSYEYTEFQTPEVNIQQGIDSARQRCIAWGYADAEPFGGQKSTCQQLGGVSGCTKTLVTIEYQCIGPNVRSGEE